MVCVTCDPFDGVETKEGVNISLPGRCVFLQHGAAGFWPGWMDKLSRTCPDMAFDDPNGMAQRLCKILFPKPILPDVERLAFCDSLVCTVGRNGKPMAGSCLPGLQAVFSKGLFMFVNLCYYK